MSLTCLILGHKLPNVPDLTTEVHYEGSEKNFRTEIYRVYQPCFRCGKEFVVGRFTLKDGKVRT